MKKPPYVRETASGFYWEPSRKVRELTGYTGESLGKDPVEALRKARTRNQEVERILKAAAAGTVPEPAIVEGTVSWAIREYKLSN